MLKEMGVRKLAMSLLMVLTLATANCSRPLNKESCQPNGLDELICTYNGKDNYESDQLVQVVKKITFPTFAEGRIVVGERHFPDLTNITIDRIQEGSQITETEICGNISANYAVVTIIVGAMVCSRKIEITILYGPKDSYEVEPGMSLNIGVDATTHPQYLNQMKFEWFMYSTRDTPDTVILFLPPNNGSGLAHYFTRSQAGKNLTIIIPTVQDDNESYNDYNAVVNQQYAVKISHQYDKVILNFTINGKTMVKPIVKPRVESAASNLWIIGLILPTILFIVVILIICYRKRNCLGKGQAGRDPKPELENKGIVDNLDSVEAGYDKQKENGLPLVDGLEVYKRDEEYEEKLIMKDRQSVDPEQNPSQDSEDNGQWIPYGQREIGI